MPSPSSATEKTVIRRNAQLLEDDLDGDAADRAETICSWSDDIIDLTGKVRSMLDAVVDGGEVELEPVVLSDVLRERIDHVRSMDDDATIDAEIPDDVRVTADDMLPAVLGNVLSNAIEHNDAEDPHVDVSVVEREESVVVRIADNGPGIPDGDKDGVFGWGESSHSSSGGFGLYFIRTMVESYGGEVDVRDNDPRGTVFTLTFQAATADTSFQ